MDTDVNTDAIRSQESAPLPSSSLAITKTVVGSVTTYIVERSPARMHLWFVFLFVMLLRDCVRLFHSC